eukprot:PITA_15496
MIILSYNCRGLASLPKKLALKVLVRSNKPDIILLQETLGKGEEISGCLYKLLPGWSFHAIDTNGHSGGVVLGFNVNVLREISSWGSENVLPVERFSNELCIPLLFLNVYGPVLERERADPLSEFFQQKLASSPLVDVAPLKLHPTWINQRLGDDWIEKKLDRFLICDLLVENLQAFRHWVGDGGLLDHFPVFLEVKGYLTKLGNPFKFNSSWLSDASYTSLFNNTWKKDVFNEGDNRSQVFMDNLIRMKVASKHWALQKMLKEEETTNLVNSELALLADPNGNGYGTVESQNRIQELEMERRRILQLREQSCHLKSRAIWLQAGDENSKFFSQLCQREKKLQYNLGNEERKW